MSAEVIDIGHGHTMQFIGWNPDRELNPQYKDLPDIERVGVLIEHKAQDGSECAGFVTFDLPGVAEVFPKHPRWKVESWKPLTLSPSVLCKLCGDHGYVRNGKWIPA